MNDDDTRTPIRERVEAAIAKLEDAHGSGLTDVGQCISAISAGNVLANLAREAVADAEQAHTVPELPEVGSGPAFQLGQTQALIKDAIKDIDEVMVSLCDATDRVGTWRRDVLRDARKALRAALELGGG